MRKTIFLLFLSIKVFAQTGIGTTSPNASAKLDVNASDKGFLPPRVALTATNVFAPVAGLSGTPALATAAGLLVYNTTSNVGVSPGFYYWSGTAWIRLTIPSDNAANVTGTVAVANGGTGTTTGSITGSGALTFTAGGTNQNITMTPSGTGNTILNNNVGVGTTNVTDRLIIGSSVAIHDGGNKVIGLGYSPGSGKTLLTGFPAEVRLDPNSGRLSFATSATSFTSGDTPLLATRMSITSQGNIGIGTESPNRKLHVQSADATTLYIESTASDNNGILVLNANTGSNWDRDWHEFMIFQKQGTSIGFIGAVANSNSINYSSTSDYRLKTDLRDYKGLELVNKIRTYDYAWKSDNSRMFGVMAHELQDIIPYAVSGQKDAIDIDGKIIPQGVDYSKLTPILVKAIQEQEKKINQLIKLNKSLNRRINHIEKSARAK